MNILHVATMVSRDEAYGGPLRVALNQARSLERRGHQVVLAAGWRGAGSPPSEWHGARVSLHPVRQVLPTGFSGLMSPGLLRWLRRNTTAFDVIHVHAARDLVMLPVLSVLSLQRVPFVSQTHGMIVPDRRLTARALDALATRRLLESAGAHLALTALEEEQLSRFLRRPRIVRLHNGVPIPEIVVSANLESRPEVLFVARLHARKRPVTFVEMAAELRRRGVVARYTIIGADEGELQAVTSAIDRYSLTDEISYLGGLAHEEVLERLARAAVYVLPSINEPFPMSLLEALSVGLPSVCTPSCGLADVLRSRRAGIVAEADAMRLADAVEHLLTDQIVWAAVSRSARTTAHDLFGMEAVTDKLLNTYAEVLAASDSM
jgi:glycosyltransferase involved in cell wall biosynthesis